MHQGRRKSAGAVSTPKPRKKRSKAAPSKRSQQEEEDLEAMDDDNDLEYPSGINSEKTENPGDIDQDETEEKPLLILAPPPKKSKINTPTIKTENPIVHDLMPFLDLSTLFPVSSASQERVFDMESSNSQIGNVSSSSSNTNKPQFSFDEDIRQIAHQLSRVATARPECHDALREVMFGTILAFGNGGFNGNIGEFFKKLSDRYSN
ncbi:hypothetical protein GCK72_007636 [Caenorhabditis remanei]|uniref:Uncharacterized protein n=1 Tax=Caenorhabditis remanei TaxID=31234 RepID=A0A6A5HMV5_CAERE|nr:hypothetical protein GCK72_007636 [Caenorhabditis remanei]KAF1767677.1 hypothetical protein GCK72_007636 [Caenorhabditis remanei]